MGELAAELAAELGVVWTGESYPPPGVAFEALSPACSTARKCGDGERQQGPCPGASQRSASERAPRDGDFTL